MAPLQQAYNHQKGFEGLTVYERIRYNVINERFISRYGKKIGSIVSPSLGENSSDYYDVYLSTVINISA